MHLLATVVAVAAIAVGVRGAVAQQQGGPSQNGLSESFLAEYHALNGADKCLEDAERLHHQTVQELKIAKSHFEGIKRAIKETRSCIDKQMLDIHQAMFHWFYGRTWLQPQLWFSGGCKSYLGLV